MQKTITVDSIKKAEFYYPAVKIRTLIHNLDEELKQLSQKCLLDRVNILKQQQQQQQPQQQKQNSISSTKLFSDQTKLNYNKQIFNNNNNNINNTNNNKINNNNNNNNMKADSNTHLRTLSSIYRSRVIDAYRNRRIFTIYGNYYTIRRALLRRGWLEKLPASRYPKLQNLSEELLLQNAKRGNDYEAVAISRIINHFPAFFIWQGKGMRDAYADSHPYRNRVRRSGRLDFTTKVGLIGCAECSHWFTEDGVCRMSYPRFYRLKNNTEERSAFIEDFRRTQCRCLIRYVWENMTYTTELVDSENGTVESTVLQFALDNLKQQLMEFEKIESAESRPDDENELQNWQDFLAKSAAVLKEHAKFRAPLHEIMEAARLGRVLLDKIEEKRPDYKWDGCRNLWILKPGFSCRGLGIIIRSSLEDIVHWVSINSSRCYIAQKYIERPLLIYKTKFDIRQYLLLVIGESTVNIWLYRDCYLRFSSQEFSIDDLRESIHLTNNSVQKKYKSKPTRDPRLPRSNMWSLEQFQTYMNNTDAPANVWNDKIFKGFKENLVAVVLASLEETDLVENAFELYGCDFMLDEHYNPILIEINSTPDLSPSTDVTARICPQVLRDVVKVIVDRPQNTNADMGLFELVYEVNYKTHEDIDPVKGLELTGQTMKLESPKVKRLHKFNKRAAVVREKQKNIKQFDVSGVQFIPTKSSTAENAEKTWVKSNSKPTSSRRPKATSQVFG